MTNAAMRIDLPQKAQIEPVGTCNLKCRMCAVQFRHAALPAWMDWGLYTEVIDQLSPRLQYLHLQGLGEPLLHPRFFDMVNYAARRNITVSTSTNMTLLDAGRAKECLKSGLDALHVSLDAASAQVYETIRLNASFETVKDNLSGLLELARLEHSRLKVCIVMVLMRTNIDELPGLVRLAKELAIDEVHVQQLCQDVAEQDLPQDFRPWAGLMREQAVCDKDAAVVTSVLAQARRLAVQLGVNLRLPRLQARPGLDAATGQERCDWPWTSAYITFDGYALPCCIACAPDLIHLGNVAESGIDAIWNGTAYHRFREELQQSVPPTICRSCSIYRGVF